MAPSVGDQFLQRNIFGSKGTIIMNLNITDSNFKTYGEEQANANIASVFALTVNRSLGKGMVALP